MNCSRFIKIRVCLKFRANLQRFLWYRQLLVFVFYSRSFSCCCWFRFFLLASSSNTFWHHFLVFGELLSGLLCWAFTDFALLVQFITERYVKLLSNISSLSFISWCCCCYWLWWTCHRGCYWESAFCLQGFFLCFSCMLLRQRASIPFRVFFQSLHLPSLFERWGLKISAIGWKKGELSGDF